MSDARGHGIQQLCNYGTSRTGISLMSLFAVLCLVINAVIFNRVLIQAGGFTTDKFAQGKVLDLEKLEHDEYVLIVSRGVSLTLPSLYLLYLYFSLHTHPNLFQAETWYPRESDDDDDVLEAEASVKRSTALAILLCSISMLIFCIIHLTRTFDAVIRTRNVTAGSLGFVFIPFACTGAKNAIAADLAMKNDMNRVRFPI